MCHVSQGSPNGSQWVTCSMQMVKSWPVGLEILWWVKWWHYSLSLLPESLCWQSQHQGANDATAHIATKLPDWDSWLGTPFAGAGVSCSSINLMDAHCQISRLRFPLEMPCNDDVVSTWGLTPLSLALPPFSPDVSPTKMSQIALVSRAQNNW